jgi:hypothetical protein
MYRTRTFLDIAYSSSRFVTIVGLRFEYAFCVHCWILTDCDGDHSVRLWSPRWAGRYVRDRLQRESANTPVAYRSYASASPKERLGDAIIAVDECRASRAIASAACRDWNHTIGIRHFVKPAPSGFGLRAGCNA